MIARTTMALLLLASLACRGEEEICHGASCTSCGAEGCPSEPEPEPEPDPDPDPEPEPEPRNVIHRSVGYGSTSPLAAGDVNPLRIEGGLALFDQALPDRIGVGDALVSIFGEASSIAFVARRRSSTSYELQTAEGELPPDATTPTTRWWIYRAYTSLADAATRTPNPGIPAALSDFDGTTDRKDLVATGKVWSIACYADAVDVSPDAGFIAFQYWNTDPEHYLRIHAPSSSGEVGASQRHEGVPDEARYQLRTTRGGNTIWTLLILVGSARVEGLQLVSTASDAETSLLLVGGAEDGEVRVGRNLFLGSTGEGGRLAGAMFDAQRTDAASTLVVYDNVFHGMTYGMAMNTAECPNAVARLYSNTFHACEYGISTGPGRLVAVNNLFGDMGTDCVTQPSLVDPASDHNLCSTGQQMTGAHSASNVAASWVAPATGDLHLAGDDVAASGKGADLSADPWFPFTVDFEGDVRSGVWDVGADQRRR